MDVATCIFILWGRFCSACVCARVRVLVLHIRVFCCTHTHRNKGVLISSHKTQIFLLQQFRDKRQKPELLLTECNNAGFFQHSGVITLLNLHSLVLDSFRTKKKSQNECNKTLFFFSFFYSHWHKGAVWTELNLGASWLSLCWIWLRLSWGERKQTNSRLKWALFHPLAHFISWHAGKLQRSSTARPLLTSTVTLTLAAHCSIHWRIWLWFYLQSVLFRDVIVFDVRLTWKGEI